MRSRCRSTRPVSLHSSPCPCMSCTAGGEQLRRCDAGESAAALRLRRRRAFRSGGLLGGCGRWRRLVKWYGCFWKAFFLVDFGNPPVDAKKIRPNAESKKRSTWVLARGWDLGNARAQGNDNRLLTIHGFEAQRLSRAGKSARREPAAPAATSRLDPPAHTIIQIIIQRA